MADCWDTENMDLMTDDCLEFIRMLYIDLFLHKYSKLCSYLMFLLHFPLCSIQFFYFLKKFDIYIIAQYGPASVVFLYALISSMIPIAYEEHINACLDLKRKHFWSLRVASKKLRRSILRTAKYYVHIAKINVLLGVISYTFVLLRSAAGKEWEIMYQITFFKQHFPEHAFLLSCIFYASLLYFVIPMLVMVNLLAYFGLHTTFQARMMNERIGKISEQYLNDIELVEDGTYQRQVFKRLRFCFQRFAVLKSYIGFTLRITPHLIVIYSILAVFLMGSYVAAWYLDPEMYYPLIGILVIVTSYTGLIVVEIGQLAEDQSRASYNIMNLLPWYTFNIKNQKLFLFGLLFTKKTVKISPFEAFPVNRSMIVQSYKVFTSLSALLANTRDKIN